MPELSQRRLRTAILIVLYFCMALMGIRVGLLETESNTGAVAVIGLGVLFTFLAVVDARVMGKPLPLSAKWIIFMTWPVAVPVVAVRNRGINGVPIVLLHVALFLLISFAFFVATDILASE